MWMWERALRLAASCSARAACRARPDEARPRMTWSCCRLRVATHAHRSPAMAVAAAAGRIATTFRADAAGLAKAGEWLRAGKCVAFPTGERRRKFHGQARSGRILQPPPLPHGGRHWCVLWVELIHLAPVVASSVCSRRGANDFESLCSSSGAPLLTTRRLLPDREASPPPPHRCPGLPNPPAHPTSRACPRPRCRWLSRRNRLRPGSPRSRRGGNSSCLRIQGAAFVRSAHRARAHRLSGAPATEAGCGRIGSV